MTTFNLSARTAEHHAILGTLDIMTCRPKHRLLSRDAHPQLSTGALSSSNFLHTVYLCTKILKAGKRGTTSVTLVTLGMCRAQPRLCSCPPRRASAPQPGRRWERAGSLHRCGWESHPLPRTPTVLVQFRPLPTALGFSKNSVTTLRH